MSYRSNVLSLYKELLKYGKTLQHTDKNYYVNRVKQEFVNNKHLEEKDIPYVLKQGRVFLLSRNVFSINKKIDFSKLPKLKEEDLEENFVRGDGPGGQATATTNNCVVLKHKPSNIVVKHHGTRSLHQNRQEARRLMINKLDELYNKEDAIENQRKRLERVKSLKSQSKNEKLRKLKMEFKQNLEANKKDSE